MVGVLISIWSVAHGRWLMVGGLWSVAGRWFCTTPLLFKCTCILITLFNSVKTIKGSSFTSFFQTAFQLFKNDI